MDITKYNPLLAVAALFRTDEFGRASAFLGTCFAFRQTNYFLTANHCIGTLREAEIRIVHPHAKRTLRVEEIVRHKSADIALLKTEIIEIEDGQACFMFKTNRALGTACECYGIVETIFGDESDDLTARLFRCYIQRYMSYESRFGYSYEAAELNIACPAGLSGGPVFMADWMQSVCGLVTENLESTTYLAAVEEIQENGAVTRKQYQNMINYGVCLLLADVKDWLNEHIPKVKKTRDSP